MTDAETMVLASVQVFQAKAEHPKPIGFGSAFIVNYLNRKFFISVSHVTNHEGLTTFLETNIPFDPKDGPIIKSVGGICYFDLLNTTGIKTSEEFEKLLKTGKRKHHDICFAEIKDDDIPLLQPAMDFGVFSVPFSKKIILDLDYVALPDNAERYGFYGKINPTYFGKTLMMTPTLKHSLTYYRSDEDFHIFYAPKTIKSKKEYAGCSGAPVLDSQQRLVAVACAVTPGSKWIYGFPIKKCKELLDYALQTNLL